MLPENSFTFEGNTYEVEKTVDGRYIVMYMSFNCPPPPKGKTPEEAVEKFKEYWSTHENRIRPPSEDSETTQGTQGA